MLIGTCRSPSQPFCPARGHSLALESVTSERDRQVLALPSVSGAVIEGCAGAQKERHLCWETWELGKGSWRRGPHPDGGRGSAGRDLEEEECCSAPGAWHRGGSAVQWPERWPWSHTASGFGSRICPGFPSASGWGY